MAMPCREFETVRVAESTFKILDLPDLAREDVMNKLTGKDLCNASVANIQLAEETWESRMNEKADEFRRRRLLMKTLRVFYFFWSDFLNKDIVVDIDSYHIVDVIFAPIIDDTDPRDYEDSGVRKLIVVYHDGKDHVIRQHLINPWTGPLEPEFETDDEDAILDEYKLGGGELVYNSRMKYLDNSSNPCSMDSFGFSKQSWQHGPSMDQGWIKQRPGMEQGWFYHGPKSSASDTGRDS